MAKKKKPKTKHDVQWVEAKRLCRLNVETVRMAKELGLNPRKLIGNRPSKAQPWKAPVHVWIRDLYDMRQAKAARKRAAKAERKTQKRVLHPTLPRPAQNKTRSPIRTSSTRGP